MNLYFVCHTCREISLANSRIFSSVAAQVDIMRSSLFLERGRFMFFVAPAFDRLVSVRRHFVLGFGRFLLDELGRFVDILII